MSLAPARALGLRRVRERAAIYRGAGTILLPVLRVLVLERFERLLRHLDHDLALALDAGLAGEAGAGAHVEAEVEAVALLVGHLGERAVAGLHVDVAGRAGAVAAAGVADGGARVLRGLEDGGPLGHLDGELPVL